MKKPILLISKVEVIEVPDEGSNVMECTNESYDDNIRPISRAGIPRAQQMNLEIEYADVKRFYSYEDVTPEGYPKGRDIQKHETKIAMTRDVQMQLGEPFKTINMLENEVRSANNTLARAVDQLNGLIIERDEFDRVYVEMLNMSIWSRVKFLLLARVW